MNDEHEMLEMLGRIGALVAGSHIVYTSGKHGSEYFNKDAIYPHTRETSQLCRALASRFAPDGIEAVVAPATGGIVLSQWVAHHLSDITGRDVLAVYAEKDGDGFVLKRGYDRLIAGKTVLVLEDVMTTGGSARKVIALARALGATVAGLGALCNRGGVQTADVGDPPKMVALLRLTLAAWEATDCPLCAKNVPVNIDIGKGREYLARRAAGGGG